MLKKSPYEILLWQRLIFKFNEIPCIFQSNAEALTIAKNSEFETIDQLKQGNIYLCFSFRKIANFLNFLHLELFHTFSF